MSIVNVAIIGAGWWGTHAHIPALQNHPHARVIAVQARSEEKAAAIARDFNIPHACTTVEQVLALAELDAVVISTTPNMHYEQTKQVLQAGKHVVIEKPMTITAAQAQELVDIAHQNQLYFVISCPMHYSPHAIEARRLVESGALGQLKMVTMMFTNLVAGLYAGKRLDQAFGIDAQTSPERIPYRMPNQSSYSNPAISGGGHIYTQISHVAAMLGFITQSPPTDVFARFDNAGTAVDVYDAIDLRLRNGALVSIASHGLPMPGDSHFEIRLFGDQGAISMDITKGSMSFTNRAGHATHYPEVPAADRAPRFAPARNVVDLILGQGVNGSPATLGLYAMHVIEAASRSAHTGANIAVPAWLT